MFFSELEDKLMRPFAKSLRTHPKSLIKMKLQDGAELLVSFDTCYESDNGLEMDEQGYEEFFCYLFKVRKILSASKENATAYQEGTFFEINYHTLPVEMSFI